jgi:hypothetical protein
MVQKDRYRDASRNSTQSVIKVLLLNKNIGKVMAILGPRRQKLGATRLELIFTDPGSTSILSLYGARVGCPAWAGFVFAVLPPWGAPPIARD